MDKEIKGWFKAFELGKDIWIVTACDGEAEEWPTLCTYTGKGAQDAAELMAEALNRSLGTI